jgi:glycosyltransferase involved in cell wall biosynthesis
MGYLCKYLPENEWEPVVITEYIPQQTYAELAKECRNVTYINYYQSSNHLIRTTKYIFVFLADFFFGYKDRRMIKIARQQIENHQITLILASTYRTFPLRTAHRLSRQYKLPLIVDLRDIIEQFPGNEHISKKIAGFDRLNRLIAGIMTKKLYQQRNRVLKDADAVTTVSPWHVETLRHFARNVRLIYNGFDPDLFIAERVIADKFKITYTGRLMSAELRDPVLLFEAVSVLKDSLSIDPDKFRIQFYTDGDSAKTFKEMAKNHQISEFVDFFGYIPNHKIPDILNGSSMLLLLTNRSSGEKASKGIMTTKVFEYLAVEKPVLCIRNDGGCLEETIRETRSGLAADSVGQVERFLLEKYGEWQQNGFTRQHVDRKKVSQFSRKEQAKQFLNIFNEVIAS